MIYPTGQAWTIPNESGSCATSEGTLDVSASASPTGAACALGGVVGRDVLMSQGTRGVLEITATANSSTCAQYPVPPACMPFAK